MVMSSQTKFHVLAVDDSNIDRKLIETLLKTSAYHVTAVDSGCKALEFLGLLESEETHKDLEINMIITDYSMPGMTGYELLRKIKESKYLKDVPVVIMSSENVPSRINRCLEEGAEEFFLKPVQLSDVKKLKPHLKKRKENKSPNKERIKRFSLENHVPETGFLANEAENSNRENAILSPEARTKELAQLGSVWN